MTVLSYFNIIVSVALVVFLFTGSQHKKARDYFIMTILLFLAAVSGSLVSLSYLGAI